MLIYSVVAEKNDQSVSFGGQKRFSIPIAEIVRGLKNISGMTERCYTEAFIEIEIINQFKEAFMLVYLFSSKDGELIRVG